MTPSSAAASETSATVASPVVNDFTIDVGTVNGTGSQTANNTLIKAIMAMGVPVSGKNIFPSNIQGLPTWFNMRVSEAGWLGRAPHADVLICLNWATARDDVLKAHPGSCVIYDTPFKLEKERDDLEFYAVPFGKIIKACCPTPKLWKLVTNMIYVGVAAELLGIELEAIDGALQQAFGNKPKAVKINMDAVRAGADYARENFTKRPRFQVERRDLTGGKILIDGNAAAGLGAFMAGCRILAWYPITPSSSVADALGGFLDKYCTDEDGTQHFANVQAEDELAAIGMVVGANWAGARAMTATSGPGISLMSEFIGLAYYAEVPAVIANIQRVGPSTGLPTRTAQGDITMCALNSHGDTKHGMVLPASPAECYEMMMDAFDLAERFQTPIFFVSDLDLGMNNWMSEPFEYPQGEIDRGKVLTKEQLLEIGVEKWGRYLDMDGDGICYRTLPGSMDVPGAGFFTRGSGHSEFARYTESSEVYVRNLDRLGRKFETLKSAVPAPLVSVADTPASVGVIAYGTTHWAIEEARGELAAQHGVTFDYLRLRAFPFPQSVEDFIAAHDRVYVIEQNREGQMLGLIRTEMPAISDRLRSIRLYDGMPACAANVVAALAAQENEQR